MLLAALTLLSLSVVLSEALQETQIIYRCARDYIRVGNICYHLSAEKVKWREALFKCEDLGGKLAVLDSKLEDQKLRKYLNRHRPDKNERWIAGSYDSNKNVWRWAYKGEPFKYQGFSRQRRRGNAWKCTVMDYYLLYRWNSRSCLQKKKYICERPMEVIKSKTGAKLSNSIKRVDRQRLRIPNRRRSKTVSPIVKNLNDIIIWK